MRCADLRDLLHPFLDGELEVAQNVAILKHAELCAACRARVESEKQLSQVVERAASEPLSAADQDRLLAGAFARAEATQPSPAFGRARLLARAAVVLAALGIGWLVTADPLCLGGCPTSHIMARATEAARAAPIPLAELARSNPDLQLRPFDRLKRCRIEILGANVVSAPGMPDRPIFRVRCKKSGKRATFVWIPGGHSHFWQRSTGPDGRIYLRTEKAQVKLVGWEDGQGVWGCLGEANEDTLYAMASAVRDRDP